MRKAIEKLSEDIIRCYRCGDCREKWRYYTGSFGVCPVREELRHEHFCGRGRTAIARAILEDKLEYHEGMLDLIYSDLCCWNCKESCSLLEGYRIRVSEITKAMREDMVKLGLGPPEPLKKIDSNIDKTGNRFGNGRKNRNNWAKEFNLPNRGETLYFAGCYASYVYPETAQATVEILRKANVEIAILEDEKCCGVTSLWDGNVEIAKQQAKHNVNAIRDSGANRVVLSCAEGYHTLKFDYPELLGIELDFEVLHNSEFISSLIDEKEITLKSNEKQLTVTYHDPCNLGRGSGIYQAPRKIIESIPGVTLVEMLRNHENSWCCGSGTGQVVRSALPDLANNIAISRLKEASDTNAEVLVTTCPFCISMFNMAQKKSEIDIEIQSLTDFVLEYI